ncbi:pyrroline-5-carboxylate reductase [Sphingomonas aracearum]|uniref:Pyrroline-5-carboxylate reductase n=1 Tax=Sphingomonas aracearum TaxID=2283317 RepID=A0A369VW18_9SPHN|nr:pyrroline-5-carboxylate reductase [Sphingomonas aracearum]RDE06538.1 pyrroline-5-carboxylate reductase [Sphingomonas aracearum]
MIDVSLLLVGAGNMGGAMLRHWLASGLPAERITVVSPSGRPAPAGVKVVREVPEPDAGLDYDVVLLALKPQQLAAVRGGALSRHRPKVLMSVLAGVDEATLSGLCEAEAVVRAMPNLPVAIGRGVTALYSSSQDATVREVAEALSSPLGLVEWIAEERLFDAVTALSGCGPGFVFRFVEALASAGAALGLPKDQAMRLALATVDGSARMAIAAEEPPSVLADRVASPGGSTRQGLNVLDRDDALVELMKATLAASAKRNAELAAAAR